MVMSIWTKQEKVIVTDQGEKARNRCLDGSLRFVASSRMKYLPLLMMADTIFDIPLCIRYFMYVSPPFCPKKVK